MYKKSPQGWLKHWDFILVDIICLQLAFVVAYFVRMGFGNPDGGISICTVPAGSYVSWTIL